MAEHFLCQGEWVNFSNGAVEEMYEFWLMEIGDDPATSGLRSIQNHLLDFRYISGGRQFGMDKNAMPKELLNEDSLTELIRLISMIQVDPLKVASLIAHDLEMVERWKVRLAKMESAVRNTLSELNNT
ncbi:MAG: hypothetical protein HC853_14270 [Anaerolineae bacterium]|nr:hypothetical protein [Anaerolineae bacterium]